MTTFMLVAVDHELNVQLTSAESHEPVLVNRLTSFDLLLPEGRGALLVAVLYHYPRVSRVAAESAALWFVTYME
jgi:hypothetical protein